MFARLLSGAAAAALIAVSAPAAAQTPAPPPVEAYARPPAMQDVSVSPSGQRLTYIASSATKQELVVQTLDGTFLGVIDLGASKVRGVRFSDDDHVIVTVSQTTKLDAGPKGEYYNSLIYSIPKRAISKVLDWSNEPALNIVAGAPTVRWVDGKAKIFVTTFLTDENFPSALFEIDPGTGRGTMIDRRDGSRLLDAQGRVIALAEYDRRRSTWSLATAEKVGARRILTVRDVPIDVPSVYGLGRTDGTALIRKKDGDEWAFYEVSLSDGALSKLDVAHPSASPVFDPQTYRLAGFTHYVDKAVYDIWDPDLARTMARARSAFKGKNARVTSLTPDRSKAVVYTDGAGDSGTYHLVDFKAGRADMIGQAYPEVPADAVAEVRWIKYKAADGLEIPAYLTLPRGREAKGLPLVVLPHGGPQARDYDGFDWWTQSIASRGYAVLQPQFRGSDGFGEAHLSAGFGEWGRKMQTDLSDGVRHLASEGVIDPERVCIFGWSYGGYAAMAGPTLDPGVYRCSIAGAGVSDLGRMVAWEKDMTGSGDSGVVRYWKRFMGADSPGDPRLDAVSPAKFADRVDGPVLIIHGKDDTVVPFEQSQIYASALRKAGKPYEFVTLEREDHWLSRASGRSTMLSALMPFLEKHNPPK